MSSLRVFDWTASVNRHKWLLCAGAVGATFGLASALNSAAAHADASDPLAGSDTAIVLGGTGEPMPSTEFAQAAEDLYLHPLGFDDGATGSTVCDMIATDPCAAPLQVLNTPELFQQDPGSFPTPTTSSSLWRTNSMLTPAHSAPITR